MCKPTSTAARSAAPVVLFSVESFSPQQDDKRDSKRSDGKTTITTTTITTAEHPVSAHPPMLSCFVSGLLFVAFLFACEHFGRLVFFHNQHWHPLLEIETNRQILARHVFVDTLSCTICAWLGWSCRDFALYPVLSGKFASTYQQRLFTYNPAAFRIALVFFWYQVKNLFDTIVWNDGPEFIFHHVFSMITAWGAMTPGCGHLYCVFFFGLSEISTAVLCLLANFDDVHGVQGLGESMPLTKVVFAAAFTTCFIVCRCILWPWFAYYFCSDILQALKSSDPRAALRRRWMQFFLISLSSLSILQVAWLGQIFILGKQELESMGFL